MPTEDVFPAAGFAMADAETEYETTQAMEMAEQTAILESIQDEAHVEANRQFIRKEQVTTKALFTELDAETEAEEVPELPRS